jgi:hypothetical protein
MLIGNTTRRLPRRFAAALALSVTLLAPAAAAAAAGPGPDLDVRACVNANGDLRLTASWAGMRVTDWSWFVESSEGSGGTFQPVPAPGNSGTVRNVFTGLDPALIDSVSATIYRSPGSDVIELGSMKLFRPNTGWRACGSGIAGPDFDVSACVNASGDLVLTASWSRMRVTDWSWFVESSEGSGGTFQPVPAPGNSGTVSNTFSGLDPNVIDTVSASLFRTPGGDTIQLASLKLFRPNAGWRTC